jgi:hypothetical protein
MGSAVGVSSHVVGGQPKAEIVALKKYLNADRNAKMPVPRVRDRGRLNENGE